MFQIFSNVLIFYILICTKQRIVYGIWIVQKSEYTCILLLFALIIKKHFYSSATSSNQGLKINKSKYLQPIKIIIIWCGKTIKANSGHFSHRFKSLYKKIWIISILIWCGTAKLYKTINLNKYESWKFLNRILISS